MCIDVRRLIARGLTYILRYYAFDMPSPLTTLSHIQRTRLFKRKHAEKHRSASRVDLLARSSLVKLCPWTMGSIAHGNTPLESFRLGDSFRLEFKVLKEFEMR
jgi:hypothetical protein